MNVTQHEVEEIEAENIIMHKKVKDLEGAVRRARDYINDSVSEDGSLCEGDRLEVVAILNVALGE